MSILGNPIINYNMMVELPGVYQRVSYLESSGTQYIILPVQTSDVASGTIVWEKLGTGAYGYDFSWIFGGSSATSSGESVGSVGVSISNINSFEGFTYGANSKVQLGVNIINTVYTLFFRIASGSQEFRINDSTTVTTTLTANITPTAMALFAIHYSEQVGDMAKARVYSFELFNANSEKIMNLIPCQRKSDSKPGMFDTVSRQFLTNGGSGEFTAGASV